MKAIWFVLSCLFFMASMSFADGIVVQENWNMKFHPIRTIVGNSGTATSWYHLTGSTSPRKNIYGDTDHIKAFRMYDANNLYNFHYSFEGSTPNASSYGTWDKDWGPYENEIEPPAYGWLDGKLIEGGVWVHLTADAGGNTTEMVFEAK